MKYLFYLVVLISICSKCHGKKANLDNQNQNKVDSVMTLYFTELEQLLKNDNYVSTNELDVSEINIFMEQLTGIVSESDHNFIGITDITERTYNEWFNWYMNNKDNLIWEIKEQRVNRRDKDIYINEDGR